MFRLPARRAPVILSRQPIDRLPDDTSLPTLPAAWECDLADDRLTWSPGVFELFGFPRDRPPDRRDVVGMYADSSRDMLRRLRSHAIATGGSFTFEAQIVAADGVRRWISITADTIVTHGRVTHLYGMKRDITAIAPFRPR